MIPQEGVGEGIQEDKEQKGTTEAEKTAGAPEKELSPEEWLKKLEEENSFLKDQLLRKAADFENFRKRMFREKEEGIKFANALLLTDLLPVIDDFERAIQSAEGSRDFQSFHAGVAMIENHLVSLLERNWGLKRFSAEGEEFDPEKHQAIAVEASDEHKTGMVLQDLQKGYMLHNRVLRPAQVKVSQPKGNTPQSETSKE